MRLAIIGSRSCPRIEINESYFPFVPTSIVSGGAIGADTWAREYAHKNNISIVEFLPDYKTHGRKAPILRNIKIVENCDFLIAFWDGFSRGTKFTIEYARKKRIPVEVYRI